MRNNVYEVHNQEPSPTKSIITSPRSSKNEKDEVINSLQKSNYDLEREI